MWTAQRWIWAIFTHKLAYLGFFGKPSTSRCRKHCMWFRWGSCLDRAQLGRFSNTVQREVHQTSDRLTVFTAQSSAVAQISVSDVKWQSEQQSAAAFQCFTCSYDFYRQINRRVGITPADLALLPDGWRFTAAVSELRGHSSLWASARLPAFTRTN